jgi:two-component system, chemotaxis family, protein-glutamate methylesterase/glutaminase
LKSDLPARSTDGAPLRVVIVNDSRTMRASLRAALAATSDFEVIAEAADGLEAVEVVARTRPAVVLMDVVMPHSDGYAATRAIMARVPTPIVMISAVVDPRDSAVVFETLEAGALCIAEAPPAPSDPQYRFRCASLVQLVRSMAAIDVTRSRRGRDVAPAPLLPRRATRSASNISVIGLAASTGGPGALVAILAALPLDVMPPILIVQHIAAGFTESFALWLKERTHHAVEVARHGVPLERGRVYVASDDRHLGISADYRIDLSADAPIGRQRPSCDHLFFSLARFAGPRSLGVVLTGMADDGAAGAVALRRAGGMIAAQDEATSVIYGMPKAALERGGVDDVLALGEIAAWLCNRSGIS